MSLGNIFKLLMIIQKIEFGKNLRLRGWPLIVKHKSAQICIGDNVTINSSFLSNLVGLYSRTIICARVAGAEIIIGSQVGISGATIYARKSIIIGDNTLIGGNVKILDNDFHPLEVEARNSNIKEKIKARPIVIGKNCFIGCNAIILKGASLGDGCVVGAGAVVNGIFEPESMILGNPGRDTRKKL
jgi:acetyltransferase-like isoleucine patch superfamily enzyme